MMRVVFMGTPDLAATILSSLAEEHEVVGVFTRPDAVRGRGKKLVASPVKQLALELGIPTYTTDELKAEGGAALVAGLEPDVICVAACGVILPKCILDIPKQGCLNVHTSLLPRWRGAAPIERAILSRDEVTGVCIMRMDEGLDTGPYCVRTEIPVEDRYLDEVSEELARAGAEGLLAALAELESGEGLTWVDQSAEGITYAEKISKGELLCDTNEDAGELVAKVRASSASHPCRLELAGRRLAVERAQMVTDEAVLDAIGELPAGFATCVTKRLFIGTQRGIVELEQVKPDGKKSMPGCAFASGIQGIKNKHVAWGKA